MYCRTPATRTLRGNEKQFLLASYRGRLKNLIYHVAVIFWSRERNFSSSWRGILVFQVRVDWVKMTRKRGESQGKLDLVWVSDLRSSSYPSSSYRGSTVSFFLLEYKLLLKEANTEFSLLCSLVPIPPFQYIDSVFLLFCTTKIYVDCIYCRITLALFSCFFAGTPLFNRRRVIIIIIIISNLL